MLKPINVIISVNKLVKILNDKLENPNNFHNDFCLISFMLGNDYLPKLKYVMEKNLIETYKKFSKSKLCLYKNGINLKNLKIFLVLLMDNIHSKKIQIENINLTDAKKYLDGLEWCMKMYKKMECIDTEFQCNIKPQNLFNIILFLHNNC